MNVQTAIVNEPETPSNPDPSWGKATRDRSERLFLEGSRSRLAEIARALRVFTEMLKGFRALRSVGPCATVFGSARFDENHRYYQMAREVGRELGLAGFTVMTGGGPGIMEAANRGARDVGAPSVGCNIRLPQEQKPNPYLDKFVEFRYFFVRKMMLVKYSYAFIAPPGGFGTLDEVFECATLIQTGKIRNFPLVLMGRDYWAPLLGFLREMMAPQATIGRGDISRITVTDDPAEVAELVSRLAMSQFGLKRSRRTQKLKSKTSKLI
jgi:uncharacterized protein (TIGR00730 family)